AVVQGPAPAEKGGAEAPKPAKGSDAPVRSGQQPDWVTGYDVQYPAEQYLCGVGFGAERGIAESGSFAALSRIFEVNVQSASRDFIGAYTKTGAAPLEIQTSEQLTHLTTQKIFTGVELKEIWQAKDKT